MKSIVKNKYLHATRGGAGLDVFIDFPKHVLHLKQYEKGGQYFLMYFSGVEGAQFEKSCNDDSVITMYDNSYFEYKIEGKLPSMTKYVNDIVKYNPDIIMADVDYSEYNQMWSEYAIRALCNEDTLLMAIPHGDTIEQVAEVIDAMGRDCYVDIIGIPYQFNGFNRTDIIAYCIAHDMWCWNKAVHMLGLASSNEIYDHRDLIRICQNIISIDTSFPVLLGCDNKGLLEVDENGRFLQDKPKINIVTCPTDGTSEENILANIKCFKENVAKLTTGYAKVAFVGAAGTGKTTTSNNLAQLLGDKAIYLKYPSIHEVCDYRDAELADLATSLYTGCNIMAATMQFDKTAILDRCLIDNIAYAWSNNNDKQVGVFTKVFDKFCGGISSIAVVYPLESQDIEEDGKRITDKEVQKKMHNIFMDTIGMLHITNRHVVNLMGNRTVEERIEDFLKAI